MKYRSDIDGLRSIAVLPVVSYHAGIPGPSGGFIGVDVFFVISGFLITTIVAREIAEDGFSLISFYERRARRILPALTAVILACFALGWFTLLPEEMKDLGASAFAAALFASNIYFTLNLDYFTPAAEFSPLLHTWSLAVEEQFYLFFSLLLMLLAWRKWWHPFWIVVGLSLLSLAAAIVFLPSRPDWVFYQIFFRAWELGAGSILALAKQHPPKSRAVREVLAVAALAAILVPVFTYHAAMPFPGATALPPVLGATFLIWIGAHGAGSIVNTILSHRLLVWVGLISYSLYLWHWPIIVFLRISLGTVDFPMAFASAAVILSFFMAWLSFRFVERPFRTRPTEGFGTGFIFSAAAFSLVSVVAVGLTLNVSGGLPARLPNEVNVIASFAEDRNNRREECRSRLPSDGLCTLGSLPSHDERVDFLFWGDSHADAFMPAMDESADRLGQNGLFAWSSACPPILGIQRASNGQECTNFNESVWSWLEQRTDVPVVILGARWTLSVEGTRYLGEAGNDVRLKWINDSGTYPSGSGNAAYVEAGLQDTVSKILATRRRVVLLGPVPEVGQNVPSVTARKALLGWTPDVSVARQDFEARAGRTERILSSVAEASSEVWYVPLSDLFCGAQICQTTNAEGQPLYVDDDHISKTAALTLLSPRFKDILDQAQN